MCPISPDLWPSWLEAKPGQWTWDRSVPVRVSTCPGTLLKYDSLLILKTHCFRGAVRSHRHTNSTPKIKEVVQTTTHRGTERGRHCSWWSTKTSTHLWVYESDMLPWQIPFHLVLQSQLAAETQTKWLTAGLPPRSPPSWVGGERNT